MQHCFTLLCHLSGHPGRKETLRNVFTYLLLHFLFNYVLGNTDLLLYSSDNPTSDRICKSNTPGTQLQEEDDDASIYSDTDRSITNSTGTVLIEAAEKGDVSKVREVLDKTVIDPDRRTRYQARSALHLACGYGQYPVVEELLLVGNPYISHLLRNVNP